MLKIWLQIAFIPIMETRGIRCSSTGGNHRGDIIHATIPPINRRLLKGIQVQETPGGLLMAGLSKFEESFRWGCYKLTPFHAPPKVFNPLPWQKKTTTHKHTHLGNDQMREIIFLSLYL